MACRLVFHPSGFKCLRIGHRGHRGQTSSIRVLSPPPTVPWPSSCRVAAVSEPVERQPSTVRQPYSSPCAPDDERCLQVEALLQNILYYPRLPVKVYTWLPAITADVKQMEHLVVNMEEFFGREYTLFLLRKCPMLLSLEFSAVYERYQSISSWMGFGESQMLLVLRKNPFLLLHPTEVYKSRLDGFKRLLPYTNDQFKNLILKAPVILDFHVDVLKRKMDYLRTLASTRETWQEDVEMITPSLFVFFLRKSNMYLRRLEYLVLTGERPSCRLREVFKPSNNLFARRHVGYKNWLHRIGREQKARQLKRKQAQS